MGGGSGGCRLRTSWAARGAGRSVGQDRMAGRMLGGAGRQPGFDGNLDGAVRWDDGGRRSDRGGWCRPLVRAPPDPGRRHSARVRGNSFGAAGDGFSVDSSVGHAARLRESRSRFSAADCLSSSECRLDLGPGRGSGSGRWYSRVQRADGPNRMYRGRAACRPEGAGKVRAPCVTPASERYPIGAPPALAARLPVCTEPTGVRSCALPLLVSCW